MLRFSVNVCWRESRGEVFEVCVGGCMCGGGVSGMPQKKIYQYSKADAAPQITAVTVMTVTADRAATFRSPGRL